MQTQKLFGEREILIPGIKNPFSGIVNGNCIPSQIQKNKMGIKTIVVHLNENPNLFITLKPGSYKMPLEILYDENEKKTNNK